MCGISAIISPASTGCPTKELAAMTSAIRHRGPDDEGFAIFRGDTLNIEILGGPDTPCNVYNNTLPYSPLNNIDGALAEPMLVGFGHRRLPIVDLSPSGHQPMCSADQRYWIVYNGEIYNHPELREELEGVGYRFISSSDTEVILHAYHHWGKECLSRFNGMFAFVLLDRQQRKIFAARDRFGVKPLYYWISPHGFLAFASEIKQFTILYGWRAEINGQRTYDFLHWGLSDHTDETLFQGVYQLLGGEALEIDIGSFRTRQPRTGEHLPVWRWYTLKGQVYTGSFESAASELHDLLEDSVRLRLRADVPVGSCLSGGIDSSSIVCLARNLLDKEGVSCSQKTFSSCSEISRYDERGYIDSVIRHTGVSGYYVYPTPDRLFGILDKLTWQQDEPFGSTSIFAQWCVFELAKANGVKVMLDGQGADEQLAGYHSFFWPRLSGLLLKGAWITLARELGSIHALHGYAPSFALRNAMGLFLPEALRHPLRLLLRNRALYSDWLDMSQLKAIPCDPFSDGNARTIFSETFARSQLTSTNLPMLLHWEDRSSMSHSVEARVPFLDYRVVEFVLGLPENYKVSDGITKRVLRAAMRDALPESVCSRTDKMGFVTPEEIWFKQQHSATFRKATRDAIEFSAGILNDKAIERLDKMIDGSETFNFSYWRVIGLGSWIRKFNVGL